MPGSGSTPIQQIISICENKNMVRQTYYSSTYRARFTVNDVTAEWDIEKITIPPREDVIKKAAEHFRVTPDETFKNDLTAMLKRHVAVLSYINKNLKDIPDIDNLVYVPEHIVPNKHSSGTTSYYILFRPAELLMGSHQIYDTKILLSSLANLAMRLFISSSRIADIAGIFSGSIDVSTLLLTNINGSNPNTKTKEIIVYNHWLDSSMKSKVDPAPHPYSIFEDEDVVNSTTPRSISTEIHSVANLIESIASGVHYSARGALSDEQKTQFPPEFLSVLEDMRIQDPDQTKIKRNLYQLNKIIRQQQNKDFMIRLVKPVFEPSKPDPVKEDESDIAADPDGNQPTQELKKYKTTVVSDQSDEESPIRADEYIIVFEDDDVETESSKGQPDEEEKYTIIFEDDDIQPEQSDNTTDDNDYYTIVFEDDEEEDTESSDQDGTYTIIFEDD